MDAVLVLPIRGAHTMNDAQRIALMCRIQGLEYGLGYAMGAYLEWPEAQGMPLLAQINETSYELMKAKQLLAQHTTTTH